MKIQLSLAATYCPTWGLWEGVRELVQNWMDAKDDGFDGEIQQMGDLLILTNNDATITADQLALFGETSKASTKARGQFGEGMKIGILALLRQGLGVKVRAGDLSWSASIEPSPTGTPVLTLRSRKVCGTFPGVQVRVVGIDETTWEEFRPRFRFNKKPGIVLDQAGAVFVKGIWVQSTKFEFGYDLDSAETDRDRRIVKEFDLLYGVSQLVLDAFRREEITAERLYGLFEAASQDVAYAHYHWIESDRAALQAVFEKIHGPKAIPVSSQDQAEKAEHAGFAGVVAPQCLVEATEVFTRRRIAECRVQEVYSFGDLTPKEAAVLCHVSGTVLGHTGPVQVVRFGDVRTMGRREGNVIQIARKVLADPKKTLITLVEEIAHDSGCDGSFEHKWRLHEIYSNLLEEKLAS